MSCKNSLINLKHINSINSTIFKKNPSPLRCKPNVNWKCVSYHWHNYMIILSCALSIFSDAQDCTPNAPTNGDVTPTTVTDGSDALYTCNNGFTLDGTSPLTCTTGTIVGTEPTCKAGTKV